MYIWWLLKFVEVFFFWKAYQTLSRCQNFPTAQPAKLVKLTTKTQKLKKNAACNHHCPLRHPAPSLGQWYTVVYLRIFDPGPSNPTTFLGLCSPGDYRQSIESPMGVSTFNCTEKSLTFTIYDCILRIRSKKVCYLTKAFIKKWKWWIDNIFAFLCIFDGLLNFGGCFFVESLPNPVVMPERSNWSALSSCQNFPTGQPAKLGKY